MNNQVANNRNSEVVANLLYANHEMNKEIIKITGEMASNIVSQKWIEEKADDFQYTIEDIKSGIDNLGAIFDWGFTEIIWNIELNRKALLEIKEVLSRPLETVSKELRDRADEAFKNTWYDEALEYYLEAEKNNKLDYLIHLGIGIIYLKNKNNNSKALEYFSKAIKYSSPYSNYYCAYALLYKAYVYEKMEKIIEAKNCTVEALKKNSDFAEALYQKARYSAYLGENIDDLYLAIHIDKNYCLKAINDDYFKKAKDKVEKIIEKSKNHIKEVVIKKLEELNNKIKYLDNIKLRIKGQINTEFKDNQFTENITVINTTIRTIQEYLSRNTYYDIAEISESVFTTIDDAINNQLIYLKTLTTEIINLRKEEENKCADKYIETSKASNFIEYVVFFVYFYMLPAIEIYYSRINKGGLGLESWMYMTIPIINIFAFIIITITKQNYIELIVYAFFVIILIATHNKKYNKLDDIKRSFLYGRYYAETNKYREIEKEICSVLDNDDLPIGERDGYE